MKRTRLSSGAIWEDIVGYSRAIKVGNVIEITGTTSVNGDQFVGQDDPYEQTRFILSKIEGYLKELDSCIEDVVRTRIFTTDISKWEAIARAHSEVFGQIKPATTLVEISGLIDSRMLVEIEATAIVDSHD